MGDTNVQGAGFLAQRNEQAPPWTEAWEHPCLVKADLPFDSEFTLCRRSAYADAMGE